MTNKEAVRKLLLILNDYRREIIVIIGCLIISSGLSLCIPLLSKAIMDDGFIGKNQELLIKLVLCSLLIYFINCLIELFKEKKRIDISAKIQMYLSEVSFSHLMKMKAGYFSNKNYAEILNNLNLDINNMTSIADESVFFVATQAFSMLGGCLGLFIIDYRLTILVLVFIPIKYVIMKYFAKKQKQTMDRFIHDNEVYARWFGDTVGGIREIKLYNLYEKKHVEFLNKQMKLIKNQKQLNMLSQWNSITDTILVQILVTIVYIMGAKFVFSMELSVGSIFAFITYSIYVTGPISAILNIGYLLSGIIPSTKRYYEFMNLQEEERNGKKSVLPQYGDIEIQNLSFSYDMKKSVLQNINLTISKGDKVAFVGKNGSGKSTMINLILGMYEPAEGRILLSGSNIADTDLKEYRGLISVVSQDIYLFNTTIRNNICLYSDIEDDKLMDICRLSGLEEFIQQVSFDYIVGQNGAMVSGGQKQKIALARVLVKNSPIVILDEATSSADACTEQQINALLHTKFLDKTVIVITHKTEILSEVKQIFELNT